MAALHRVAPKNPGIPPVSQDSILQKAKTQFFLLNKRRRSATSIADLALPQIDLETIWSRINATVRVLREARVTCGTFLVDRNIDMALAEVNTADGTVHSFGADKANVDYDDPVAVLERYAFQMHIEDSVLQQDFLEIYLTDLAVKDEVKSAAQRRFWLYIHLLRLEHFVFWQLPKYSVGVKSERPYSTLSFLA